MPRNGSGVFSPSIDFTDEANSPPIEISKLDSVLVDIGDALTASVAADGQTSPTADLKMATFKHTNVGAATALNQYGRVQEIIDQDLIFYVDSGSANTLAITPSPAIAAYEEGQRFVVRAAANNSGATTLNVNGLGAIAVQTPDGTALASGAIITGGIYEFTYDANTTPDRWVMTSMPSDIPDGMLSSNVPLKNAANTYTANQVISNTDPAMRLNDTNAGTDAKSILLRNSGGGYAVSSAADATPDTAVTNLISGQRDGTNWSLLAFDAAEIDFKGGTVTTDGLSAAEVGYSGTPLNTQNGNYTLVLTDRSKTIYKASGGAGETITIPANASVAFAIGTQIDIVNNGGGALTIAITTDTLSWTLTGGTGSRTLADHGWAVLKKVTATEWFIAGTGLS